MSNRKDCSIPNLWEAFQMISGSPLSLSNCVYSRQMNLCNSIHVSQMEKNVCLSSVWGQTPNSWWNLKRTETKWELRVRPAGSTASSSVDSTWNTRHPVQIYSNRWFSLYLDLCSDKFCGIITFGYGYKHLRQGGTFVTLIFPFCGHFQWTGLRRSGILCCIWQLLMRHRAPGVSHLSPCGWWARYYPDLPPAEIEINPGPSKQ